MGDQTLTLPGLDAIGSKRSGMPAWPLLLLAAAFVYAAMPLVHHLVYGRERLVDAAVSDLSWRAGAALSAEGRELIAQQFTLAPTWGTAVLSFAATLFAIVIAGVLLNFGTTLVSSDITPAQALGAAAVAGASVALVRVILWCLVLVARGSEQVTGIGWMAHGSVNLRSFLPEGAGSTVVYLATGADLTLLLGAFVAALALMARDEELSFPAAVVIGMLWPLAVLGWKVMVSYALGFPIG